MPKVSKRIIGQENSGSIYVTPEKPTTKPRNYSPKPKPRIEIPFDEEPIKINLFDLF
jgi:hypothetical protein